MDLYKANNQILHFLNLLVSEKSDLGIGGAQ